MSKIYTGLDIIRGKTFKNPMMGNVSLFDFTPWHMIPEEEKTEEWVKYVADFYEMIGWKDVQNNSKRIYKNRKLVAGELDMTDYVTNVDENEFAEMVLGLDKDISDPLKQYYPVIPNAVQILVGESMQKDYRVIVKAVDQFSTDERLQFKDQQLRSLLEEKAITDRQVALIQQGFIPDPNNEQLMEAYQKEMEMIQRAAQIENEFKTFRTQGEIFGQHALVINREKHKLDAWEKEGFTEMLTNARVTFHIDMQEDNFRFEMIDNAVSFGHKSPSIREYHKGDYFGWFEFMSAGEVINKFGRHPEFTEDKMDHLKDTLERQATAILLPDHLRTYQGAYYDSTVPYDKQVPVNRSYQESINEYGVKSYLGTDGSGKTTEELLSMQAGRAGDPRLFRVMRLYFRSQRKIGWLTKMNRSGQIEYQDWVDENFKVTVNPEYDNSLLKEKSRKTLIYGEHVDWSWSNQWRHVIKISNNLEHTFWRSEQENSKFQPIILDGKPCKFQFKGSDNKDDIFPPFIAREFRNYGGKAFSLAERMKPWQIGTNICFNKVIKTVAEDRGKVLVLPKQTMPREYIDAGDDPVASYLENVRENKVVEISLTKENLQGVGSNMPLTPSMLNLSSVDEAQLYFQLGQAMKFEALESVGITRQRIGAAKPYETAAGVDAGIKFSEAQTLQYFNDFFVEFMPEVFQRILEATQYYCTQSDSAVLDYINKEEFVKYLEIAKTDLLHRHLHIYATATPRVKALEEKLKNLLLSDNTMGLGILEKAEGLYAETTTEYMQKLRVWDKERKQREEEQFLQQQETARYQTDRMAEIEKERMDREDRNKQLDRESEERQKLFEIFRSESSAATMASNPNVDNAIDAALKEREIEAKAEQASEQASEAKQTRIDSTLLKNKEIDAKLKMKQIDEKIARMNKN